MSTINLLGVKSNDLLFWMPGFPNRQAKAMYRFKRRLGYAKSIFYKGFFCTLTIAEEKGSYIPVQKWQHANSFFFSEDATDNWDYCDFKHCYEDLQDDVTSYIRKFFNKLQTWCKRNSIKKVTYVWRLEKGEERGRLHVHVLFRFNIDIGAVRYPLWFIKRLHEYWNAGYIFWECMDGDYNKVSNYITKYFTKGVKDTAFNKRRFGTSRDLPGYKPNENVYYIHEEVYIGFLRSRGIKNIRISKNFYKWFIKTFKAKFQGYRDLKLDDGRVLYVADVEFYTWDYQDNLKIS